MTPVDTASTPVPSTMPSPQPPIHEQPARSRRRHRGGAGHARAQPPPRHLIERASAWRSQQHLAQSFVGFGSSTQRRGAFMANPPLAGAT